jgi:hypothetical protein
VIVISGALVLVALVLLIIGLVSTALPFVYASIAVSIVAGVFLGVGVRQRRGEPLAEPGAGGAPVPAPATVTDREGLTAILPASGTETAMATAPRRTADSTEPAEVETTETTETTEAAEDTEATELVGPGASVDEDPATEVEPVTGYDAAPATSRVLVMAGRPRYHAAGCRYLTGKDADEAEVAAARAEGFTACGVCKPDEGAAVAVPEPAAPRTRTSTTRSTGGRSTTPPAKTAAAKTAAAKTAAAKTAAAKTAPAKTAPAKTAPAKTAAKAAPAAATSSPARRPGSVVVIPDRGKFHRAVCRYVRDVPGAQELTKAQATRQGFEACGVCKP